MPKQSKKVAAKQAQLGRKKKRFDDRAPAANIGLSLPPTDSAPADSSPVADSTAVAEPPRPRPAPKAHPAPQNKLPAAPYLRTDLLAITVVTTVLVVALVVAAIVVR